MADSMKSKILAIAIVLIMIGSTFIASANINSDDKIEIKTSGTDDIINIRVARLSSTIGIPRTRSLLEIILNGYQWTVGNITYRIRTYPITDRDIIHRVLSTEYFDLIIVPWSDGVKELAKRSYPSLRNKIWKTKFTNFVKSGGGFIGICASTHLASKLVDKPKTFPEAVSNYVDLEISGVKLVFNFNVPILARLSSKPESIGTYAYFDYKEGIPLDVVVNKSNPIFDDFLEDTRRIVWEAGPAFVLPDETTHNISVLAYYPETEISDNPNTTIHAWKFAGGIRGFISNFLKAIKQGDNFREALIAAKNKFFDWDVTDKKIETNYSNKPFMTMETYPNENQGRIVLCGGHPETSVWWGGHLEEASDTDSNTKRYDFYTWTNKTPYDETLEDEFTYNWWILQRQVAWASKKVPDNDLPPVYGPSQISDIHPYNQSSEFTIIGNAEVSDGIMSLNLYYRYSDNNSNWTPWMLYYTDIDGSNGWSWEFNAPNGTGHYQFYSLRHVEYEHEWLNETTPPGPDAIAYVQIE